MKKYLTKYKRVSYGFLGLSVFVLGGLYPSQSSAGVPDDYGIPYADATLIESDATWSSTEVHEIANPTYVVNGATLTIEPGTEVKFVDSESNNNYGSGVLGVVDGTVVASGTERAKIRFTGETLSFSLLFSRYDSARETSLLRYVEIGDGQDEAPTDGGGLGWLRDILVNKVLATASGPSSIYYGGGRVIVENAVFKNKYNTSIYIQGGVEVEGQSGDYLHVSNSNFEDLPSEPTIVSQADCPLDGECRYRVKLQNNYYGLASGPDDTAFDGPSFGATFRTKPLIADPVIIVPGILGSDQNSHGIWEIDPILHVYDDQIKSLESNGYTKGVNLFVMPYDWHKDNVITASLLKQQVLDAVRISGVSKVDLLAHSMGGLVSRQYIEGNDYGDDVDQLITLGTPHRGAPESYATWVGGECISSFKCVALKLQLNNEAEHAGYSELYKYIQEGVVSVGQLLPDYSYLKNISDGSLRGYPADYPRNFFLENLNSQENIDKLNLIRFWNIVGDSKKDTTAVSVRVGGLFPYSSGKWEYGFPESFDTTDTDQGFTRGKGDGTVPLMSAEFPSQTIDKKVVTAAHTELPKKAQCEALEALTAKTDCQYIDEWSITNILRLDIFSPIDVQVVSPSGKRVGKDFATGEILSEIPGAFYSGYTTETEFVTIPNPEDGEYRIFTEGVDGGGHYRIEASSIKEDSDTGMVSQSQKNFEGEAVAGAVVEAPLVIEDAVVVVEEDSGDTTPPETTIALSGLMGTNGWYRSKVSVTLVTESGATTEYSLDNGNSWINYTNPFEVTQEGVSKVLYRSADEAQNMEVYKEQEIKIDTENPEGIISFDTTTEKLKVFGKEEGVSVVVGDSWYLLTDPAGNTTKLTFTKTKNRKSKDGFVLQSIQYDQEPVIVLKDTKIKYFYKDNQRREHAKAFSAYLESGNQKLTAHYLRKKNRTYIMDKTETEDDDPETCERRRVTKILPGLVVPYIETSQGKVTIKY